MIQILWAWGPAATLMAGLFIMSSIPEPPQVPGDMSDFGAHAIAYSVLGGLVLRALAGARWLGITVARSANALAIAAVYGLSDEFHQSFVPGRVSDVRDLVADVLGALAGVLLVWACSIVLSNR